MTEAEQFGFVITAMVWLTAEKVGVDRWAVIGVFVSMIVCTIVGKVMP